MARMAKDDLLSAIADFGADTDSYFIRKTIATLILCGVSPREIEKLTSNRITKIDVVNCISQLVVNELTDLVPLVASGVCHVPAYAPLPPVFRTLAAEAQSQHMH